MQMRSIQKGCLALACALGAGVAIAQNVARDAKAASKPTPALAQASPGTTAPIQTAQAGGASTGASTAGATAGATAGVGAVIAVGVAIATIAVATDSTETTTHH
jgi:hypothetical protein